MFDFAVEDGLLCGQVAQGEEYGPAAGEMAAQILAGTSAVDIPIRYGAPTNCPVNRATAGRFTIALPAERTDCQLVE